MSIPAETRPTHTCPLPYPHLFVDELPWYTPGLPDDDDGFSAVNLPGRSVSIDHPRYEDGRLVRCPVCKTWWVFRTHPIPPGDYLGMVQCVTTYKPRWHMVSWWDFALRRRIREAEAAGKIEPFPPPPVLPPARRDTPPRSF